MSVLAQVQRVLRWGFFSRCEEASGALDVIKWWEVRRIPFNLIVGATGALTMIVTLVVAAIASEKFGEPLGLPDPPIFAVFAVIAYGIAANVCYTGGWLAEILARSIWGDRAGSFGEIAFALGLGFSILLTLAPAALFTVVLILRLLLQ